MLDFLCVSDPSRSYRNPSARIYIYIYLLFLINEVFSRNIIYTYTLFLMPKVPAANVRKHLQYAFDLFTEITSDSHFARNLLANR